MGRTSIEWTDVSWPIVNGCRRASPGCVNCYAERLAATRLSKTPKYGGLAVFQPGRGPQWTGESRLWERDLDMPLRLKAPSKVFVADMGDLFYEGVPDDVIDRVMAVMLLAPRHTFQVLTKRAKRMREYLRSPSLYDRVLEAAALIRARRPELTGVGISNPTQFPPPWIWFGVSVENQKYADERIPELLASPAAVRFVSYEPALGPIDFKGWGDQAAGDGLSAGDSWESFEWPVWVPSKSRTQIEKFWSSSYGRGPRDWLRDHATQQVPATGAECVVAVHDGWADVNKMAADGVRGRYVHLWNNIGQIVTSDGNAIHASGGIGSGWLSHWLTRNGTYKSKLDWIIVGGESGPGARPFDLAWARSVVAQCKGAGVAAFVKQLGAKVLGRDCEHGRAGKPCSFTDAKGGKWDEWPEDLRVREWPR